ncbi:DUF1538 family protein [Arthrobacter sp. CAL618]|uniref:DUF1538 family protein n=1 Tax=Arthrobacter sp. CAL618 TaxID=1055770 RepID=UPI000A04F084|nr:DUF1538 family protein [Arthrobacter sp. CAL618]
MEHFSRFKGEFLKALRNLLPIVVVVVVFQVFVFRSVADEPGVLLAGLFIVTVGVVLFLYGLDLSIFPVGKNLANQFVRRGALSLLLPFGFAIGFLPLSRGGRILLRAASPWGGVLIMPVACRGGAPSAGRPFPPPQ